MWTAVVDQSEEWPSQYIFQLERRSLKKSGLPLSNCLKLELEFTAIIILHFDLPLQFTYELFHMYFTLFHSSREIWTQQIDLAPNVWLHSSVGRASYRYCGGHRFKSRWSPDFFRLLFSNCLNWKIYCDDHSLLLITLLLCGHFDVSIERLLHVFWNISDLI